ncbi:trans-L-3-hydroxyproline dehydratase-like isoform X2 [Dysidea avara]|uniref:trans-L-3-hydroxyproline dehydratase-like isoform X2 n=1 Tax=Dysidea avara TaxID=196820 RepID=UPI003316AA08
MSHNRITPLNSPFIIKTIDMCTAGDPARIVQSRYPDIKGATILDKLHYAENHLDHLRKLVIQEPRGHHEMYGMVPVKSDLDEADMAVLFINSAGYTRMCNHCAIALGRYAVDHGIVKGVSPETIVKIQCPCGLVTAHVEYQDGKAGAVRIDSVPCFVFAADLTVNLGYGTIHYDIAYGGSYFIYTDITQFGLDIHSSPASHIVSEALKLKAAVVASVTLTHPVQDELAFFSAVYFYCGSLESLSDTISELCIYDDTVCRSPCGSGCSGFLALLYHRRLFKEGEVKKFVNSKTRSSFNGKIVKQVKVKDTPAVIVEISGKGYYTGECIPSTVNKMTLNLHFLLNSNIYK